MNRIRISIVIFITIILQNTVLSRISVFGVHPNLAIPVIVAISIGFGCYAGGYSGLTIGLIEDILFSPVIGFRALVYFIIGFFIGNFEYRLNIRDNKTGMLITILATIANFLFIFIVGLFTGDATTMIAHMKGPILVELILNPAVYFLAMKLLSRIFVFPNVRFY